MAVNNEWIEKYPFQKFKIRMEKKERDFLTLRELRKIQDFQTKIERLQIVKDLFVFSCYTGLPYRELMNLKQSNIINGFDGNLWIQMKREKTSKTLSIPLLPKAIKIMKKYNNEDYISLKA